MFLLIGTKTHANRWPSALILQSLGGYGDKQQPLVYDPTFGVLDHPWGYVCRLTKIQRLNKFLVPRGHIYAEGGHIRKGVRIPLPTSGNI